MGYSAPPANPSLDMTSNFASIAQSLVLFDQAEGLPRNLVNNAIPKRSLGCLRGNGGSDAEWLPTAFTGDTIPSPMLRFGSNSPSLISPYGGFSTNTPRAGTNEDREYVLMYSIDSVDFPDVELAWVPLMLCGSTGTAYGLNGTASGPHGPGQWGWTYPDTLR